MRKAADTSWTGSLEMPRGCGTPGACQVHFVLNANQIALGGLSEWVKPSPKERPWYRVLESSPQAGPSFLASVRASGQRNHRPLATAESGGDAGFGEGEPGQREIGDFGVERGFSGRKASRRMAGRLQREAGGLQRQREPDRNFAGAPCRCDEGRVDCGHGEYEIRNEGTVPCGLLDIG